MAGQEIEDDLWDQSLGFDLPPPSARIGFRTHYPWNLPPLCKILEAETRV